MSCGSPPGLNRRESLGRLGAFSAAIPLGAVALPTAACAQEPAAGSVSVVDFGAVGDGSHDDTDAFRQALEQGTVVLVPPARRAYRLSRSLRLTRPGQRLIGSGPASRIVQSGEGRDSSIFVTEHDDCGFVALALSPGGSIGSLTEGWAIVLSGAERCLVQDCHISRMRRGGVMLWDASDCRVAGNWFTDSLVRGDASELQSETGHDIYLGGASSRNMVTANHCLSGVGTGIGCQTAERGKSQFDNMIVANLIEGQPGYGIMAYLSDPGDRIDRLTIQDNVIGGISGAIRTDGRTRFYGCGIYVQTSNDFLILGNRVRDTNTDRRLPFAGSSVPAAIGISGHGNGVVQANLIDGCFDGIASIQTTERPRAGDGTLIADNIVRRCGRTGILLADCVSAQVTGNRLSGAPSGAEGVRVQRVAVDWVGEFTIADNHIHDFAVGVATLGSPVRSAIVTGNQVVRNSGHGVHLTAETALVHHNRVEGAYGLSLSPTVRAGICSENLLRVSEEAIVDGTGGACAVARNVVQTLPKG